MPCAMQVMKERARKRKLAEVELDRQGKIREMEAIAERLTRAAAKVGDGWPQILGVESVDNNAGLGVVSCRETMLDFERIIMV